MTLGGAHPAITAPPTGTIEGVVNDAQGEPLSGVQLTLRATTGRIAKRAASGPDGHYRFAGIAAGGYSISGAKGEVATATAAVAVRAGDGVVRVEVTDRAGPGTPKLRPAGCDAEGGRGLQLVAGLAARWGWRRRGGRMVTWFELQAKLH